MAKSERQKLKLLYILKILWDETDEFHPISTQKLIERLEKYDIKAERKTIYRDMDDLREFGLDIGFNANKSNGGYYMEQRLFELPELKILVDMVQASRFLTQKKSRSMIEKLEGLTNKHQSKELARSVYVSGRAKSQNETMYYLVDKLHQAMNGDYAVTFQYFEYSVDKELVYKKQGALYHVSPYYLTFANENYYLIGTDDRLGTIRHYRVDRMKHLEVAALPRENKKLFENFDISKYSNGVFGMYGGETKRVTLIFSNELVNVVIDRFGRDVNIHKNDENTFKCICEVTTSQQFFGWLAGFGVKASIESPKEVRREYHEFIGQIYLMSGE